MVFFLVDENVEKSDGFWWKERNHAQEVEKGRRFPFVIVSRCWNGHSYDLLCIGVEISLSSVGMFFILQNVFPHHWVGSRLLAS